MSKNYTEERAVKDLHAVEFRKSDSKFNDFPGELHFDLHWNTIWWCRGGNADDDFWDGAILVTLNEIPTRILNPTDQLLHVCVHGARYGRNAYSYAPVPILRWAADAIQILSSSDIDWDRFIYQAQKRSLELQLRDALYYLEEITGAQFPLGTIEKIDNISRTRASRIHHTLTIGNSEPKYFKILFKFYQGYFVWLLKHYSTDEVNHFNEVQLAMKFFAYMKDYFGAKYSWLLFR